MAKEMFSARVDVDLRDALALEAERERRTMSNMLEWILRERYAALSEGGGGLSANMRQVTNMSPPLPSVSAGSVPAVVHDVPVRPHRKKGRPAVECPSRVLVDGVCPECGATG